MGFNYTEQPGIENLVTTLKRRKGGCPFIRYPPCPHPPPPTPSPHCNIVALQADIDLMMAVAHPHDGIVGDRDGDR